jgi:hypothetical protein
MKLDLFEEAPRKTSGAMSAKEAAEALRRARNAVLSKPFAHLLSNRDSYEFGGRKLFDRVHPVQAALHFLGLVSHSMVFARPTSDSEMRRELAGHIADQAGAGHLTDEQALRAAEIVVSALRNQAGNWERFRETFRDPLTHKDIHFEFELLVTDVMIEAKEEVVVYKLTREGVQLLHLNLGANEEFDMLSVIVKNLVMHGRYDDALSHVLICRDKSVEIESQIGDIIRALKQQSFEDSFQEKVSSLIEEASRQSDAFRQTYEDFRTLFQSTADADLDPDQKEGIRLIRRELENIFHIQSRLSNKMTECVRVHKTLIERTVENLGVSTSVPDIQKDFLIKMAAIPVERITDRFTNLLTATLMGAVDCGIMDPFIFIDKVRTTDFEGVAEEDEEIPPEPKTASAMSYSINDTRIVGKLVRDALAAEGAGDGLRLSHFHDRIMTMKLSTSVRQAAMHKLALLPSQVDGRQIQKTWDGTMIDNTFLRGPDLVFKFART